MDNTIKNRAEAFADKLLHEIENIEDLERFLGEEFWDE